VLAALALLSGAGLVALVVFSLLRAGEQARASSCSTRGARPR